MLLTENVALTEHEQQRLKAIAQQTGTSQAELLRKAVQLFIADFERPYPPRTRRPRRHRSESARQRARQRFERHFGTLPASVAGSVANEDIDADLALAYAATHEAN